MKATDVVAPGSIVTNFTEIEFYPSIRGSDCMFITYSEIFLVIKTMSGRELQCIHPKYGIGYLNKGKVDCLITNQ